MRLVSLSLVPHFLSSRKASSRVHPDRLSLVRPPIYRLRYALSEFDSFGPRAGHESDKRTQDGRERFLDLVRLFEFGFGEE
jgi:hypothetical protein